MRNASKLFRGMTLLPVVLLFNACGAADDGTELLEAEQEMAEGQTISADLGHVDALTHYDARESIAFTEFDDAIGDKGARGARRLFTSAEAYRRYFGHDAPNVDFANEWVLFFSAGLQSTGGYDASITSIRVAERLETLYVTTRLESPGPDCIVTQALTRPYALVKFNRPYGRGWVSKYRAVNDVKSCSATSPCALVLCEPGTTCEVVGGEPVCLADPGGCAAIRCAEGTHCEENGGRAQCVADVHPCAAVLCAPGTTCVVSEDGTPTCEAPPPPGCAATLCLEGTLCVEDEQGNASCRTPCSVDEDCSAVADYCTGCDCRGLARGESLPVCEGPGVRCFADPCRGKTAVCRDQVCTIADPRLLDR